MTVIFFRLMEFSVYGTLWLLLLFIVSFFAGKKSGVLWQYLVSVCIAIHLLVPVHIQWISLELPMITVGNGEVSDEPAETEDTYDAGLLAEKSASDPEKQNEPEDMSRIPSEKITEDAPVYHRSGDQVTSGNQIMDMGERHRTVRPVLLLEAVWICGMLFFLGRTVLYYLAFCKQAKRWSLPARPLAGQVLEEVKNRYHVGRRITLWRNSKVASPVLYGVFRPVILLPDQEYSRQEYRYIFRHELSHYKHADVLMKYVFTACRIVYWFHPLVWWMCRRAYVQMELLCDEAVVAGKDIEDKREYSMVILRHMTGDALCGRLPLATSFYGGKDYMKMRFEHIMDTTKKKAGIGAVLVAAVMVLVFGGVKWSNAAADRGETSAKKTGVEKEEAVEEKVTGHKILVIGTDYNATAKKIKKTAGLADAIMLAEVDAKQGIVAVHDIPRELLVDFKEVVSGHPELMDQQNIPGQKPEKQKLGAAYGVYGYEWIAAAVEDLFEVKIDSHIIVSYRSVPEIIDAAGGVEVTLTKKEAAYLNRTNYISRKENRNVTAGKQILNGDQATGYMRIRKVDAGSPVVDGKKSTQKENFGRMQRCNNVILGMEKQIRKNKVDWVEIIQSLMREKKKTELDVDLSAEELYLLIKKVVTGELDVVVTGTEASGNYKSGYSKELGSWLVPNDTEVYHNAAIME